MNPEMIDTRVGTKNTADFSNGNALPLTGVPWGMNYLAVQTTLDDTAWWFDPSAHTYAGIRITHQASPWVGDFQHLVMRAVSTPEATGLSDYRPEAATFAPHRLDLFDIGAGVRTEATNGLYGGALRFTAEENPLFLQLYLPAKSTLVAVHDQTLILRTENFADSADPHFGMFAAFHLPVAVPSDLGTAGAALPAVITIPLGKGTATVHFATSFIDADQAERNLAPLVAVSFDALVAQHATAWQDQLAAVHVRDHHPERVALLAANLYRTLLFPMRFYELDASGAPIHYDTTARKAQPGKLFTNNGFWDTYKSVYPLYSLLWPEQSAEFLAGFLTSYRETGFLPRWLAPDERGMMPGTMIDAVIADAAVKGIAPELMPDFLAAMIHGAETSSADPKYGREGLADYRQLGYVPAKIPESVNKTLDYAYSDWLISVVADGLGEQAVAEKYRALSGNWRHLFDPAVGLMHPKTRAGAFTTDYRTTTWGNGFTEGSAWQNSFAVYQDIPGLIDATGGKAAFLAQLHRLVNQPPTYQVGSYGGTIHEMREMAALDFGQLAISNQPSFHLPYLFALAGEPAATQLLVKQLVTTAFAASPTGYPGDEDNGSMAAWVVFALLGFYPVTPGSGDYVLGIPMLDDVTLTLGNGKSLRLTTANNHDYLMAVGSRTLNGAELGTTVSHAELMAGGTLESRLQVLPD